MEKKAKNVFIEWLDGKTESIKAVEAEEKEYRTCLKKENGDIMVVPFCNVRHYDIIND